VARRLDGLDAALDALLARRGELRAQLDHDREQAAGDDRDPALERLHRRAQEALGRAPCDLAAAADLVSRYSEAVRIRP
jgi:hypothetical protein